MGRLVIAFSTHYSVRTSNINEVKALLDALSLCCMMINLKEVDVELHSKVDISWRQGTVVVPWCVEELCSCHNLSKQVLHVFRETNKVADCLPNLS